MKVATYVAAKVCRNDRLWVLQNSGKGIKFYYINYELDCLKNISRKAAKSQRIDKLDVFNMDNYFFIKKNYYGDMIQ